MDVRRIAEVKNLARQNGNLFGPGDQPVETHAARRLWTSDAFWALAKHAESIQESVVQLDRLNTKVYLSLVELGEVTWKGLRSRLAHAFWKIDSGV